MTAASLERAVELVLLFVAAWPVMGPCVSRPFWRAFPALARWLAGVLVAYAAGVALVATAGPPSLLRGAAALALAVLVAVQWHSSVARGRRHRWPPGSLQPLALGPWSRQEFFLEEFRRFGSPFKTSQFLRPTACLVGLPGALDFFRDHDASLASPPWSFGRFIPGGFLRHMPPERHDPVKEVFRAAFLREVYEPREHFIRDVFRVELARMAENTGARGVPPRRHIQRAVFQIWVQLFLGIESTTDDYQQLKALYTIIDIRNPSGASGRRIRDAVEQIVAIARRQPAGHTQTGTDAPQCFLEALARSRPGSVEDATMIGNLVYMLHTTWADVSGLLQWVLRMLTDHAEWADRLRHALSAGGSPDETTASLSTRIVMETLRLEQSEYLYRVTTRDVEHNGLAIPRGWLVRLCVRESHQDATVFESPQTFDPDRFLHRTFTRREYAPFGAGLRHACLGEHLTKTVGRIFAEELARGYQWRTVADGPAEHSAWRHWRPASAWRIVLTSRGGGAAASQQA